jgi:LacI family transcriptional regulator
VVRAGIKDVAGLAKVSVGTVSHVLNHPEKVAPGTRARVEHAIAALGFTRNESARQLRAGRSRIVAYVLLDSRNPFFTDVARGVEEAVSQAGLALFLCDSDQDAQRETDYLDLLLEQRVRGVLVTPISSDASRLRELSGQGVPVVLVDRAVQDGFDGCSVSVDDVEGGFLAVSHLLEFGHRRIAFVGGPGDLSQVRDRGAGARKAFAAGSLDPEMLIEFPTAGLSVGEGRRAGEALLGLPAARRPSAAFCANDLLALGLLQQLTRYGLHVPHDMAIVGYDDIEFAAAAVVPLTSVRQPRHQLGLTAATLLLEEDEMTARKGAHTHRQIRFEPSLVVRESSLARVSS